MLLNMDLRIFVNDAERGLNESVAFLSHDRSSDQYKLRLLYANLETRVIARPT